MTRSGWRGYVSSRPMRGQWAPQRVQNLVIRSYAQSRGLTYLLSATEYGMEGCWMILRSLEKEAADLEGIIFYTIDQLPETHEERQALFAAVLGAGAKLHFALEELVIEDANGIAAMNDLFLVRRLACSSSGMSKIL